MNSLATQFSTASCHFPSFRFGYSAGYPVRKYAIKKAVSIMTTNRLNTAPAPTSWRTCKSSTAEAMKNVQHDRGVMNQVLSQAHTAQPQALDVMFSRDNGAGTKISQPRAAVTCTWTRIAIMLCPILRTNDLISEIRSFFFFLTAIITMSQLVETK